MQQSTEDESSWLWWCPDFLIFCTSCQFSNIQRNLFRHLSDGLAHFMRAWLTSRYSDFGMFTSKKVTSTAALSHTPKIRTDCLLMFVTTSLPKKKLGCSVKRKSERMSEFFGTYTQLKAVKQRMFLMFYIITFIDLCKYLLILNLMMATCLKPFGTWATKDWKHLFVTFHRWTGLLETDWAWKEHPRKTVLHKQGR